MQSLNGIKSSRDKKDPLLDISRKIYLSYKTEVFRDDEEIEFYIINSISKYFNVPFSSVQVCGSAKTGLSFHKEKKFITCESDLDIAVISLELFNKFAESANEISKGYSDLSCFPLYRGNRTDKQFKWNFLKGTINPFFMPKCELKSKWIDYFNSLSNKYISTFKSITGCIYSSEYFYEFKQKDNIDKYLSDEEKYDKICGSI